MNRPRSFTDQLRADVIDALGIRACPTCGHVKLSLRKTGVKTGVNYTSLWRFLQGDKLPSAKMINALVAWLGKQRKK